MVEDLLLLRSSASRVSCLFVSHELPSRSENYDLGSEHARAGELITRYLVRAIRENLRICVRCSDTHVLEGESRPRSSDVCCLCSEVDSLRSW